MTYISALKNDPRHNGDGLWHRTGMSVGKRQASRMIRLKTAT